MNYAKELPERMHMYEILDVYEKRELKKLNSRYF